MPMIQRGILWSLKVWSAVVTFLLGLAGAVPPAQGGQSGTWQSKGNGTAPTADQRPGGTIVLAQDTSRSAVPAASVKPVTLSPAEITLTPEVLQSGQGPFTGTTRWMPPEKGVGAFTLAGPWHATNDGGFGQTLNGQTLVLYPEGISKLFDQNGTLLSSRQNPTQVELFKALKKSSAMVPAK